jgi:DNA repair protein RecN (Recombination protein N)
VTTQLVELAVRDLGIIEGARIVFGPGMTALTGETGAGKTLLVGAIELLLGGRADPSVVRSGCAEAVVEGRFTIDGQELVLSRVIPADGRSRAYIDGRMATASALGERAGELIDLHGQHDHQSLLAPVVQRDALDRFGGVDLTALDAARRRRRELLASLDELGGDVGARAREADLLRFQVDELDHAQLDDADEDARLDADESALADAAAHREAAARALEEIAGDHGALDRVGAAVGALDGRSPFADVWGRLRNLQAELADLAGDLRATGERIEEDPGALAALRQRRQLLVELRRKYGRAPHHDAPEGGDGSLGAVMAYHRAARQRLGEIEGHDQRAAELEASLSEAAAAEAAAAASVGQARRRAAEPLAAAVGEHLAALAMGSARFAVHVGGDDPGDQVTFMLAANRGAAAGPLAKVASGGELARTMLALRLVLSAAPPILVFDEVDAGIGGQAALAVGRALAQLAADHQVLVVTHLPQVAAFADRQVSVRKQEGRDRTQATATSVDGPERVLELSRMLSGLPNSERVQDAATELLELAARQRGR